MVSVRELNREFLLDILFRRFSEKRDLKYAEQFRALLHDLCVMSDDELRLMYHEP